MGEGQDAMTVGDQKAWVALGGKLAPADPEGELPWALVSWCDHGWRYDVICKRRGGMMRLHRRGDIM